MAATAESLSEQATTEHREKSAEKTGNAVDGREEGGKVAGGEKEIDGEGVGDKGKDKNGNDQEKSIC